MSAQETKKKPTVEELQAILDDDKVRFIEVMENGEIRAREEDPAEDEVIPVIVGGEIHIIADAKTGSFKVSAPPNKIIAYGLLEIAKEIISARKGEVKPPLIHSANANTPLTPLRSH